MALSATPIIPVLSANSLDSAHADSKVYPPQSGTTTTSNDVGAGEQILRNQTHTLNEIKVDIAGDTMTGLLTANAGITVASGQDLTLDGAAVKGVVGFSSLGRIWLAGRKQLWRTRQALADSNHTVNVDQGDRFTLPVGPAAPRVITLQSTGVVPTAGETLTFFWQPGTTAVGAGTQYTFRNEAAATLLTFDGSAVIDTGLVWVEFEFVAGAWALGLSSSTLHDGVAYYGAIKP